MFNVVITATKPIHIFDSDHEGVFSKSEPMAEGRFTIVTSDDQLHTYTHADREGATKPDEVGGQITYAGNGPEMSDGCRHL